VDARSSAAKVAALVFCSAEIRLCAGVAGIPTWIGPSSPEEDRMTMDDPSGLLYLLSVGKEKELILRVHGTMPTAEDLVTWMEQGRVVSLQISHEGELGTFTYAVNFTHVVAARLAPYTTTRISSF
jgi:hypothetical protein